MGERTTDSGRRVVSTKVRQIRRVSRLYSWKNTAALYRKMGYRVDKTERNQGGFRKDLFGIIDGIAIGVGRTIGLQACTGSDRAEHMRKLTQLRKVVSLQWLEAGNELHLVTWRKLKSKGWYPKIEKLNLDLTFTDISHIQELSK